MKKLLTILALFTTLTAIGAESTKKIETYEDLVKKEETARKVELESFEKESVDTYETDRKEEEKERAHEESLLDTESGPDKAVYIEVKDDAGYDRNNMDKIRERNHRAWDSEQREFDKPWNRDIKRNSDDV